MSNKAFQIVERKIYESSKLKFAGVDGLQKNITRCGRSRWWDQ